MLGSPIAYAYPFPNRYLALPGPEVIPTTKATEVFRNPKIRDRILGFIHDKKDMTSCILVEKEWMVSAFKRLYATTVETMSFKWLASGATFVGLLSGNLTK